MYSKYKLPLFMLGGFLLVYILLAITLQTMTPIVVQKDDSMIHRFNYNSWLDEFALCDGLNCTQEVYLLGYNITKRDFLEFPFNDGINKRSIIFLSGTKNVEQGDVIVVKQNGKKQVTRILEIEKTKEGRVLYTKTDMAPYIEDKDIFTLDAGKDDFYVGKALFKI